MNGEMNPLFFVPDLDSEKQEHAYVEMAKHCGREVPGPEHRVFSIVYRHDGQTWTATVGEQLLGKDRKIRRGREYNTELHDEATVLAIFIGTPTMVFTNKSRLRAVGSQWENPFCVGQPNPIRYFRQE